MNSIRDWLFHKGLVLFFLLSIKRRELFYANLVEIVGWQIHSKFLSVCWVCEDHRVVRPNVVFISSIQLKLHWYLLAAKLPFYV